MQLETAWTALMVAEALVRAYKLLDGAPVMSRGGGFVVDDTRIGPLSLAAWVGMRRYVTDPQDLRYLRVWASCKASGERASPRFRALAWHPKTVDRHCKAALKKIAAGLNAERDMAGEGSRLID